MLILIKLCRLARAQTNLHVISNRFQTFRRIAFGSRLYETRSHVEMNVVKLTKEQQLDVIDRTFHGNL